MPMAPLVYRLIKGSPLSASEGDGNLTKIRNAINALEQLFGVVLKPNGQLKDGAVSSTAVLADGIVTNAKLAADARVPAGAMLDFGGASVPSGYLACDGSAVSRTTYADLFTAIGTVWGVGDGSTTFTLPDLRGRSSMGDGTGAGLSARTLADTVGVESVTLTAAQSGLPAHTHTVPWRDNTTPAGSGQTTGTMTSSPNQNIATSSAATQDASTSHQNIHPVRVVKKIIKT